MQPTTQNITKTFFECFLRHDDDVDDDDDLVVRLKALTAELDLHLLCVAEVNEKQEHDGSRCGLFRTCHRLGKV